MDSKELEERTRAPAVRVPKLAGALPKSAAGKTVANQLARSSTSAASNYGAALRAKSDAGLINKITIVLKEAGGLTKIFSATRTTTRRRIKATKPNHNS